VPDRLVSDRAGIDGGTTVLKIYYDGRCVTAADGQPSYLALDLRDYMMTMPHNIALKKVSDEFDIGF